MDILYPLKWLRLQQNIPYPMGFCPWECFICSSQLQEDKTSVFVPEELPIQIPEDPDVLYENEEDECIICLDSHKDSVFIPCGHYCCCFECAEQCKDCPLCRGKFTSLIRKI